MDGVAGLSARVLDIVKSPGGGEEIGRGRGRAGRLGEVAMVGAPAVTMVDVLKRCSSVSMRRLRASPSASNVGAREGGGGGLV